MPADIVVIDSDVALFTDPFGGGETEDTVLDASNGIACCCGLECTRCCGNNFVHNCCYSSGTRPDELLGYNFHFEFTNTACGSVLLGDYNAVQNGEALIFSNTVRDICSVRVPVDMDFIGRDCSGVQRFHYTGSASIAPWRLQGGGQIVDGVGLLDRNPLANNWLGFAVAEGSDPTFGVFDAAYEFMMDLRTEDDECNGSTLNLTKVFAAGGGIQTNILRASFYVRGRMRRCINNCTVCPP